MADANSSIDRRARSPLLDDIVRVRASLRARIETEGGHPTADWSQALETLAILEQRLDGLAGATPSDAPRRGLSGSPGTPFVAMVGIDRFNGMRDDLGEPGANAAVNTLCERIARCAPHVHLGRINRSSIEFTFFAAGFEEAEGVLADLQRRLEAPIPLDGREVCLDVAIGFAGRDAEKDDLEALVDRAEHALAKTRANHVKIGAFTERDRAERIERLSLMRDLRGAVANDELVVFYQPKLSLRASAVTSMEALVRWRHPARGFVPPDTFIPLAEETGEVRSVTELVVRKAIVQSDLLAGAGRKVRIDLNISGTLIAEPAFAAWVLETMRGRETRFGFEITETAVIANPEKALHHIRAFSEAGIAIAIDDYGSGLSSLSYLKQIPAHELKIDRAFVSGLTTSQRDPLLVRSTIDLAHALEMEVTAEGVDNAMSLALLRVMGCDMVQGYHISRPLPFDELCLFLDAFSAETFERPAIRATA